MTFEFFPNRQMLMSHNIKTTDKEMWLKLIFLLTVQFCRETVDLSIQSR